MRKQALLAVVLTTASFAAIAACGSTDLPVADTNNNGDASVNSADASQNTDAGPNNTADASKDAAKDSAPTGCPDDCSGHGTCSGTTCTCAAGYSGANCGSCAAGFQDKNNDKTCSAECSAATCTSAANGTCDDTSGTATCTCLGFYAGANCSACVTGHEGAACDTCSAGYQDNDTNGSCLQACGAGGLTCENGGNCADGVGAASCDCRGPFMGANCSTACDAGKGGPGCEWTLVYGLNLANNADWNNPADVPYDIDNSAAAPAFTRIGYRMKIGADEATAEEVFVELDAFRTDATKIGIPVNPDYFVDQTITNVVVHSWSAAVANNLSPVDGKAEFWSDCYGTGLNGVYDYEDDHSGEDCYGSFQIAVGTNMIFSYNAWSTGQNDDLGFGNQVGGSGHPDWTFRANAPSYGYKRLEVYVK